MEINTSDPPCSGSTSQLKSTSEWNDLQPGTKISLIVVIKGHIVIRLQCYVDKKWTAGIQKQFTMQITTKKKKKHPKPPNHHHHHTKPNPNLAFHFRATVWKTKTKAKYFWLRGKQSLLDLIALPSTPWKTASHFSTISGQVEVFLARENHPASPPVPQTLAKFIWKSWRSGGFWRLPAARLKTMVLAVSPALLKHRAGRSVCSTFISTNTW